MMAPDCPPVSEKRNHISMGIKRAVPMEPQVLVANASTHDKRPWDTRERERLKETLDRLFIKFQYRFNDDKCWVGIRDRIALHPVSPHGTIVVVQFDPTHPVYGVLHFEVPGVQDRAC